MNDFVIMFERALAVLDPKITNRYICSSNEEGHGYTQI